MKTIAFRLGIVGLIAVGGLLLRPLLAGNAGDLKVGECFDEPATLEAVEDVQHHPCTDPHTSEVFLVMDVPDAASYPTDAAFEGMVQASCVPAFDTYTGLDFATDPDWTIGYFVPTPESWSSGDRGLICYTIRIDGAPTSASLKAAG